MTDYIAQIDYSYLNDSVINPNWPGHDRSIDSINAIIVHHEAQDAADVYDDLSRYQAEVRYQAQNPTINGVGLQYHFKIDNVGQIMQCRPWNTILWHAANFDVNEHSLAICLDGNFETQVPTREQYEALKALLDWLCTQHPEFPAVQSGVYTHAEVSQLGTACCGANLRPWVTSYRTSNGAVLVPDGAYQHPELQATPQPSAVVVEPSSQTTSPVVETPIPTPVTVVLPIPEPVVTPIQTPLDTPPLTSLPSTTDSITTPVVTSNIIKPKETFVNLLTKYNKSIVAAIGVVLTLLNMGYGNNEWVQLAITAATYLGVYHVPNTAPATHI